MTIKDANIFLEIFRSEVRTEEYCVAVDKKNLDAFKPLFEDGNATEEDRKQAQQLEERIRERHNKITTLIGAIHDIETRDFAVTL